MNKKRFKQMKRLLWEGSLLRINAKELTDTLKDDSQIRFKKKRLIHNLNEAWKENK